jgi:hypothetical protein
MVPVIQRHGLHADSEQVRSEAGSRARCRARGFAWSARGRREDSQVCSASYTGGSSESRLESTDQSCVRCVAEAQRSEASKKAMRLTVWPLRKSVARQAKNPWNFRPNRPPETPAFGTRYGLVSDRADSTSCGEWFERVFGTILCSAKQSWPRNQLSGNPCRLRWSTQHWPAVYLPAHLGLDVFKRGQIPSLLRAQHVDSIAYRDLKES